MDAKQWAEYGSNPGPENWEATFAWISWRDGCCYPPPHHAPDRGDESWLTVICCDVISFFWVLGKYLRRALR